MIAASAASSLNTMMPQGEAEHPEADAAVLSSTTASQTPLASDATALRSTALRSPADLKSDGEPTHQRAIRTAPRNRLTGLSPSPDKTHGRAQKARGKFSDSRRQEVQNIRKKGACIRCRMLRKTVRLVPVPTHWNLSAHVMLHSAVKKARARPALLL